MVVVTVVYTTHDGGGDDDDQELDAQSVTETVHQCFSRATGLSTGIFFNNGFFGRGSRPTSFFSLRVAQTLVPGHQSA